MIVCELSTIEDQFNFGKYYGLSLAEVMELDPSYLSWCIKNCSGVCFMLHDSAIKEIKIVYPNFIMDKLFESCRQAKLDDLLLDDEDDEDEEYLRTYGNYSGSWAQEFEGYSDEEIDIIFDGDPDAYWNID